MPGRRIRTGIGRRGIGAPYLFKQWGEWAPGENVERQRGAVRTAFLEDDEPDLYRVGKNAAGRLLDGVEHNGTPKA